MNTCIVIIIAHKEHPTETEKASLKQCYKILGNHPIRILSPKGLNVTEYLKMQPDAQFEFIAPKWQASLGMSNRLKITPLLYKKFRTYKYILFYELDAWVFRDELEYWCTKDYDFIGAPWLEGFKNPAPNAPIIGVGNGGFSLRKTKTYLKVLRSFAYVKRPAELISNFTANKSIRNFIELLKSLTFRNNTFMLFNNSQMNDDFFWAIIIPKRFKWFIVAPATEAIKFSIEAQPERFVTSPDKLPFGCHAWQKINSEFWKKHIIIDQKQV